MSLLKRLTRSRHIHDEVGERFKAFLPNGRILDLPAGDGVNSGRLHRTGYEVVAADLFPAGIERSGFMRVGADLAKPLPFKDESFDGVLFSEGIEHLDAQVLALEEMARILKPGGIIIVTTPNLLHLSARLNFMLTGHAHSRRAAVVPTAQYWRTGDTPASKVYFGHVFLINAFQLRFYLEHAGFDVIDADTARYSVNSLLLTPLMYPAVWWSTRRFLSRRKSKLPAGKRRGYRGQALSPAVLYGKKLIVAARKRGAKAGASDADAPGH